MMLLTRPLVIAGISFLTTALVVSFFPFGVSVAVGVTLLIVSLFAFFVFHGKMRIKILLILISSLVAVSSYAIFASNEYDLSSFDLQSGMITAVVTDIAPAKGGKTAYQIRVIATTIKSMPTGFRAILYTKSDAAVDYYDRIQVEVKARKIISSPLFNTEQFYRAKGIDMTFSSYAQITVIASGEQGMLYHMKRFNAACSGMTDRYVERPYAGFVKAMLLGNDNDVEDIAYDSITKAGVSHVFVVSGLHISLIAMMVLFVLKLLGLSFRARSMVTIFASWGVVAITGFGLSGIRAGIMLTVLMGANLFRRKADTLTSLFLAGIIIVFLYPASIVDASFMLTFTATLGIILLTQPISDFLCRICHAKSKLLRYLLNVVGVTLAANLMMLPVIIYTFKGISIAAPLTNLVIVPLLPAVLVAGIVLLCFSGVPVIAGFLGGFVRILLSLILKTCEAVSTFDFAYIGLNYRFVFLWLWVTVLLLIVAAVFIKKNVIIRNVLFISLAGLLLCFTFHGIYNGDNIEVTTLNSHETQSLIITGRGGATVIAFEDDSHIDVDVANFLRSKNIHRVENYIFTSSEQKNIVDTEFLAATTDLYNLYLLSEDPLIDYVKDSFKPINGIYPLDQDAGYDILDFQGTKLSIDRFEEGILISGRIGQTKIAITNSDKIARDIDCEILYYCGKYNEMLRYNQAKCVILLKRLELDRLAGGLKSLNAYEKSISLKIRQNGAYVCSSR